MGRTVGKDRILEPEVMEDPEEVKSYREAANKPYLSSLDDTFVRHALALGFSGGLALDVGCGPAQIPIKLASKLPHVFFIVLDLSREMVRLAQENASSRGLRERVFAVRGDALKLPFRDATFDLAISNSLLHHLADPVPALKEIQRVVKAEGAVLVRDLKRPPRLLFGVHAKVFGRHYEGKMRELYVNSLRASFTYGELKWLMRAAGLAGFKAFRHSVTHIGMERKTRSSV